MQSNSNVRFAGRHIAVSLTSLVLFLVLAAGFTFSLVDGSIVSAQSGSPSPSPTASPSPGAIPFQIETDLSGAAINGIRPRGEAEFEIELSGNREFKVRVEDVNLPGGTLLNVIVDGTQVGTINLLGGLQRSELVLKTERGQTVPQINPGTRVVVASQSGATLLAGAFGNILPSPSPTPSASPSPSASPTPNPSPSPGATPFEIEADLTGAPINGIRPKGEAEFEIEISGNREFKVRVEDVNLPGGTLLNVIVDGTQVGTITLLGGFERSELVLKTERGQTVPQINSRTRVVVANQSGATLLAGAFSNIPPNPNPTPSPSPGPNAEFRIEARLAGARINGLTPVGAAKFKSRGNRREFEVEVERVNLPLNSVLGVFVDNLKVGDLILSSRLESEFELETERGQVVPNVVTGSTVAVINSQGQTVLAGVFNTVRSIRSVNDIDDSGFFVEQQYRDFLAREADDSGLQFWRQEIERCGGDDSCVQRMRVNTSGAFFLSIEFQETGYLLYRFNKASFGVMPRRNPFLVDMELARQGLVVGAPDWQRTLEENKRRIADDWVQRPEFQQRFASLSHEQYVDALFNNAGVVPTASERSALVEGLRLQRETRATVLRQIADHSQFKLQEKNPAFVLMQYFDYLGRNPDEGQDLDMSGFNFWLRKLDEADGDFHRAEMVRAFLESGEYRQRFAW